MGKRFLAITALTATCFFAVSCVANTANAANSGQIKIAANVTTDTTLSIMIDSVAGENVVMTLAPNPGTTAFQDSSDVDITVTSNNRTGYYLVMSTTSNDLINTADDTLHISGVDPANTTGYTSATLPVNSWGYSLKTGNNYSNFLGVGVGVALQEANAPAQDTTTIKFGTKVDSTLPSGVYTTSIVFTTITKPSLYMQDVALWKDSVGVGESVQAIDNRDMKSYWVTRIETDPSIPDGRAECTGTGSERVCTQLWMTQNLDLDLDSTRTYTHADTDLGWTDGDADATWRPVHSTMNNIQTIYDTIISEANAESATMEVSYSDTVDKFYYYGGGNDYRTLALDECMALLGINANDCYHFSAGNHYSGTTAVAINTRRGNNAHYITETPGMYDAFPNSVCPAGWKLPQGLSSASDYSDYDYLLYYNNVIAAHGNTYVIEDNDPPYQDHYGPYVNSVGYATHLHDDSNTETDGHYNISAYPLWFTHSGFMTLGPEATAMTLYEPAERAGYLTGNSFYAENAAGVHSTGETEDAFGIYHLHTCSDCVAPADIAQYTDLLSVRCIAR